MYWREEEHCVLKSSDRHHPLARGLTTIQQMIGIVHWREVTHCAPYNQYSTFHSVSNSFCHHHSHNTHHYPSTPVTTRHHPSPLPSLLSSSCLTALLALAPIRTYLGVGLESSGTGIGPAGVCGESTSSDDKDDGAAAATRTRFAGVAGALDGAARFPRPRAPPRGRP